MKKLSKKDLQKISGGTTKANNIWNNTNFVVGFGNNPGPIFKHKKHWWKHW